MNEKNIIKELSKPIIEDVIEELENFLKNNGIQNLIEEDGKELARITARQILDPSQIGMKKFPEIPLDPEQTSDVTIQYHLILEFLESSGFNFAANVLRYESQHPEEDYDRIQFGRDLGLPSYDKTPYLVQLIEKKLKSE